MMHREKGDIVLKTQSLKIGYSGNAGVKTVLEGLDLFLQKGQVVSILGKNGSGKTTLIKTLSGIIAPLSGQIVMVDRPMSEMTSSERAKKISVVLSQGLNPPMLTAYEVISNGRYPYTGWNGRMTSNDLEIIDLAINQTEISDLSQRKFSELSDGERQKVMIARALVQDGDVVFLDEPTAYLDVNNRLMIMQLLHRLTRKTGKTFLTSTHDLDTAFQYSDQLWLMDQHGNVISGVPEDLILNGQIERVFGNDNLKFDNETGRFRQPIEGKPYYISGTGKAILWAENGLAREGFKRMHEPGNYPELKYTDSDIPWSIQLYDTYYKFNLLSQVFNFFRNQL